jgi:deltex-like protein
LEEKKLDETIFVQLSKEELGEEICGICHSDFTEEEEGPAFKLNKCEGVHFFHKGCVGQWIKDKNQCPICKARYGVETGIQPTNGQMSVHKMKESLPGYTGCGTIQISYNFPQQVQGAEHPSPGKRLPGTYRTAFLPDNAEGQHVLKLLQTAWQRRLVFTVGTSVTRGVDGLIVWNGIHHKTSMDGGPEAYGYPDPTYLTRVRDELKQKGVE